MLRLTVTPEFFDRKSVSREASQRVPNVGRIARFKVPPSGFDFSLSVTLAICFSTAEFPGDKFRQPSLAVPVFFRDQKVKSLFALPNAEFVD